MEPMEPEPLTLPSGEVVVPRGLSGLEIALISKRNAQLADDPDEPGGVAITIGFALLGATRVREAEAAGKAWLVCHDAADFTAANNAIEALSGYGKGAAKRDVHRATDDK